MTLPVGQITADYRLKKPRGQMPLLSICAPFSFGVYLKLGNYA